MCVCVPSPTKGMGVGGEATNIVEGKMEFLNSCGKMGGGGGAGGGRGRREREMER